MAWKCKGRARVSMNRSFVVSIYSLCYQNRIMFKLFIRLKELGVYRHVKDVMGLNLGVVCSEAEMQETRDFIKTNQNRISHMLEFLEDDKSRRVWKAVMLYRAKGKPIPKSLWSENDQYFAKDIIRIGRDEVFVDGGSFIGDTVQHLLNFAKRDGGTIRKVVAFEPDESNRKRIKNNFRQNKKIFIMGKGLSDRKKVLSFFPNGSEGFFRQSKEQVHLENVIEIPCTSIDETPECHDATFIKMDIEGAEMEALLGGVTTIKRNSPKLAICIYHSLEDMVRIAEFLHENHPEYKLYIRHHTEGRSETVLYAVMRT